MAPRKTTTPRRAPKVEKPVTLKQAIRSFVSASEKLNAAHSRLIAATTRIPESARAMKARAAVDACNVAFIAAKAKLADAVGRA